MLTDEKGFFVKKVLYLGSTESARDDNGNNLSFTSYRVLFHRVGLQKVVIFKFCFNISFQLKVDLTHAGGIELWNHFIHGIVSSF